MFKKNYLEITVFFLFVFAFFVSVITIKATYNDSQKNKLEEIENIVIEKLGEGEYKYEYIDGMLTTERYLLVEGDNSFMIYDLELEMFCVYSKKENSPFFNIDKKYSKIYLSPINYIIKYEDEYIDIFHDVILTSEQVQSYKNSEIQIKEFLLYKKSLKK